MVVVAVVVLEAALEDTLVAVDASLLHHVIRLVGIIHVLIVVARTSARKVPTEEATARE